MKITVYTITDCPYSKKEKEYLTSHNFLFEEKNLEKQREYLSEMLQLSEKFTGVPFTLIEKDDGTKTTLKGFTQEEFDKTFGLVQDADKTHLSMLNAAIKPPPPPPIPSVKPQPQDAAQPNVFPVDQNAQNVQMSNMTPAPASATDATSAVPPIQLGQSADQPVQSTPAISTSEVNSPPIASTPQASNVNEASMNDLQNIANPPSNQPSADLPKIPDFPK